MNQVHVQISAAALREVHDRLQALVGDLAVYGGEDSLILDLKLRVSGEIQSACRKLEALHMEEGSTNSRASAA